MIFTMTVGNEKVFGVGIIEGFHVYSSATQYFRDWDDIPHDEQQELITLRDELEAVFMKARGIGKGN